METVGERIKLVRKKRGLNQKSFGKPLGVTATAISKIETGECSLTDQMLLAVCREFKVCEEWLSTGEGGEENMFVPHEDSNIENLAQEYRLTELSKTILKAYVKINPPERREQIDSFILDVARQVLGNKLSVTLGKAMNEIDHTSIKGTIKEELKNVVEKVFKNAFPEVELSAPPIPHQTENDELTQMRDELRADITDEEWEAQADAAANFARNEVYKQKRRVQSASTSDDSKEKATGTG